MKRALEASLAQELPASAYYVALDLGFVGEITLKPEFRTSQARRWKASNGCEISVLTDVHLIALGVQVLL